MYISLKQKKTFLLFSISLLIIAVAFFWIKKEFYPGYAEGFVPENLVLSNFLEDSVTVSWTTELKSKGYVVVYDGTEKVGSFDAKYGFGGSNIHYVNVVGLKPDTNYEFEIISNRQKFFDEDDTRFSFVTSKVSEDIPTTNVVRGKLMNQKNILVFLLIDDLSLNYPVSTYSKSDGSWSLDLEKIRALDNQEDFEMREDTPIKVLFFNGKDSTVVWGNKNVLFDTQGNFIQNDLRLNSSENVFAHVPDFAKFKKYDFVQEVTVEEKEEEEEGVVERVDEDEDEEVLGLETEEVEIEDDFKWDSLSQPSRLSDYGIR